MSPETEFRTALKAMPLVAVLRGLQPDEAVPAGRALIDAGFTIIEVPLNRPQALHSIQALAKHCGSRALIGAGTVLSRADVSAAVAAGARLIVSPHLSVDVVGEAKSQGCAVLPGVFTASEAFAARAMAVTALKLFPAESLGTNGLKALRAVLPRDEIALIPVGGIMPDDIEAWHGAGADGVGTGSGLYQPGMSGDEISRRAHLYVRHTQRVGGLKDVS